ncbi:MAG: hypothetical protein RIE32_03715 [Phycisphaerales bacterium]
MDAPVPKTVTSADRWGQFAAEHRLNPERAALVYALLDHLYETPRRAYHNIEHVTQCLDALVELEALSTESQLALWFHDAVYVAGSDGNERASAELCRTYGTWLGFEKAILDSAADAVFATTHDGMPRSEVASSVADADLSILGAATDRYRSYARSIRIEWSHVPDSDFNTGRASLLRGFLDRSSIYHTARGQELYEDAARENLTNEIETLTQ